MRTVGKLHEGSAPKQSKRDGFSSQESELRGSLQNISTGKSEVKLGVGVGGY